VVWGKKYTTFFLENIMPWHLRSGNVLLLKQNNNLSYHIFTTQSDQKYILRHKNIQRMKKYVKVDLHCVEDKSFWCDPQKKYSLYAFFLRQVVVQAHKTGSAILNLCPDAFLSDSTFTTLQKILDQGKRLVLIPSVRIQKTKGADLLRTSLKNKNIANEAVPLSKVLKILHPVTKRLIWKCRNFSYDWPSHIYHSLKNGLLIYPFHVHALYLNSRNKKVFPESTLDDDYIKFAFPEDGDIAYFQSSDEGYCLELSGLIRMASTSTKDKDLLNEVAKWVQRHCNQRHLQNFQVPFVLRAGPITPEDQQVQTMAKELAGNILCRAQQRNRWWMRFWK